MPEITIDRPKDDNLWNFESKQVKLIGYKSAGRLSAPMKANHVCCSYVENDLRDTYFSIKIKNGLGFELVYTKPTKEFHNLKTSCIETVTRCVQDTSICTKSTVIALALIGFVAIAGIAMVTLGYDLSNGHRLLSSKNVAARGPICKKY